MREVRGHRQLLKLSLPKVNRLWRPRPPATPLDTLKEGGGRGSLLIPLKLADVGVPSEMRLNGEGKLSPEVMLRYNDSLSFVDSGSGKPIEPGTTSKEDRKTCVL